MATKVLCSLDTLRYIINMIYTVIAKPTKACNADCSYCSSPPDDESSWDINTFASVWDRISPQLADGAFWIWHGGEPMLLGPDFFRECEAYVRSKGSSINFSMQSNLLLYKSKRWKSVFQDIFKGSISSSFDPDEKSRTIQGSSEKYTRTFLDKIEEVINDGFRPLVIGTYSEETAPLAHTMYERSMAMGKRAFHLRFNYQYPAGRASESGALISPETYGNTLIQLYDRWIKDVPDFMITPLDQMISSVAGTDTARCPWTKECGGRFLEIEPNGDLYNCGDMADLGDPAYRFGNVISGTINKSKAAFFDDSNFDGLVKFVGHSDAVEHHPVETSSYSRELMTTPAVLRMQRRSYDLPADCLTCRHFEECEGGCMRDAALFDRGLGGKFYYCSSWKMVFDRIKRSIISGEADSILKKMNIDPGSTRDRITLGGGDYYGA